jgi:hypothetical protein
MSGVRLVARRAAAIAGLALATVATSAHLGTNDAFFEGPAGPYAVRVSVRPPGVVPGLAQVAVRVADADVGSVRRVLVQAAQWNVGRKGAPAPDVAQPVPGERGLYATQLWLMTSGSYELNVTVEGTRGGGTATVPVLSVATARLGMQRALGTALAVLGALLVAGVVTFAGAAARESVLAPGEEPDPRRRRGARLAMAGTAAIAALVLLGGSRWWDAVDREYRRGMYRPLASEANVATTDAGQVLRFTITDSTWGKGRQTPLIPDHGKMMHMFVVREPALDVFAHLHPSRLDSTTFEGPLPPLPAGRYRVFADIVHESGFARTLVARTEISASPAARVGVVSDSFGERPRAPSRDDDAWLVGAPLAAAATGGVAPRAVAMGDGIVAESRVPGALTAGRDVTLSFTIRDSAGRVVPLDAYMGMAAHLMVMRADGDVFVHLHPMGTISMAAQERLLRRERGDTVLHGENQPVEPAAAHAMDGVTFPGELSFPFAFPKPGAYRMWLQVRQGGAIRTAAFDVAAR